MRKIIEIYTQLIALIATTIGGLYIFNIVFSKFPKVWGAINSQFFSAILTLFVGLVAYFVYLKQKRDKKSDAAKLILQEIRYAENKIRIARDANHVYSFNLKLLPTNSWSSNVHLFISDLKENELDIISRFYATVETIDSLIRSKAEKFSVLSNTDSLLESRLHGDDLVVDYSIELEFIYNTPIVEKLRRIANL